MSYILDALKKADRERSIGQVPDLEAAHWGVRHDTGPRRWLWIVAALLIINAALLVWTLGRDAGEPDATSGSLPLPAAKPESAGKTDASSASEPVTTHVPAAVPAAAVATSTPEESVPEPATAGKPLTVLRPRVAVKPHVAPPAAARSETRATTPRVVQAQEPLAATADDGGAEIPELGEMSLEFRSSFQMPRVDVHVYSEQPRRRFILVGLQKYREGDTLQNGAVLEKILPGGIQLFYQGKRFRVDR